MTRVTRKAANTPRTAPNAPPRSPLNASRRSRNSANRTASAIKNPTLAAGNPRRPNGPNVYLTAPVHATRNARTTQKSQPPRHAQAGRTLIAGSPSWEETLDSGECKRRCASGLIRLIRPHSFELSLQNQYSQPAGAEGKGPMRDVERRFALPWSIYSLNSTESSSYQIGRGEDADAADKFFQLSDVQPRHALAHGA